MKKLKLLAPAALVFLICLFLQIFPSYALDDEMQTRIDDGNKTMCVEEFCCMPCYSLFLQIFPPHPTDEIQQTTICIDEEKRLLEMTLTVPPVAQGHEAVYERFYRPNEDENDVWRQLEAFKMQADLERAKRETEEQKRKAAENQVQLLLMQQQMEVLRREAAEKEAKKAVEEREAKEADEKARKALEEQRAQEKALLKAQEQEIEALRRKAEEEERKRQVAEEEKRKLESLAQLHSLALDHYNGTGGFTQNYDEAAKCFAMAAEQGFPLSQCWLGHCYKEGRGVPQDKVKWQELYTKVADGRAVREREYRKYSSEKYDRAQVAVVDF